MSGAIPRGSFGQFMRRKRFETIAQHPLQRQQRPPSSHRPSMEVSTSAVGYPYDILTRLPTWLADFVRRRDGGEQKQAQTV